MSFWLERGVIVSYWRPPSAFVLRRRVEDAHPTTHCDPNAEIYTSL